MHSVSIQSKVIVRDMHMAPLGHGFHSQIPHARPHPPHRRMGQPESVLIPMDRGYLCAMIERCALIV